jgi:hypothetical protein
MREQAMLDASGGFIVRESLRSRFGLLFVSLALAIAVPALVPDGPAISVVFTIFLTAVLLSGLYAVSTQTKHFVIGFSMVIPAVALSWWRELGDSLVLDFISAALSAVFLAYLGWMVFLHILAARRVNADIIYAALSVYMLLGWTCGLLFFVLDVIGRQYMGGPMLSGAIIAGDLEPGGAVYYSFVTLTTLGYGDIAPVATPARALAMLEALLGQIFLVTLIARLVGLHIAHSRGESSPA